MSLAERCDEVIRVIDEALGETAPPDAVAEWSAEPHVGDGVEPLPGRWGVFYLRPTA